MDNKQGKQFIIIATILFVCIIGGVLIFIFTQAKNALHVDEDIESIDVNQLSDIIITEDVSSEGNVVTSQEVSSEEDELAVSSQESSQESYIEPYDPEPLVSDDITSQETNIPADTLILVNYENKIPDDYEVELINVMDNFYMEKEAGQAILDMFAHAYDDGITLYIISAYRTVELQQKNFDAKYFSHRNDGKSKEEAYALTSEYIAVPGYSEHHTGLAADLNSLSMSFADSVKYEWLMKNCYKYGFILRYPEGKEAITKIQYEPWHFRYVGVTAATEIMQNGLCLEEYLSER